MHGIPLALLAAGASGLGLWLALGRAAAQDDVARDALAMIEEGRATFRHDTFGDEAFWGGELRLHLAIAGRALGGVGAGLPPAAALRLP